jgi:hypothetical protein
MLIAFRRMTFWTSGPSSVEPRNPLLIGIKHLLNSHKNKKCRSLWPSLLMVVLHYYPIQKIYRCSYLKYSGFQAPTEGYVPCKVPSQGTIIRIVHFALYTCTYKGTCPSNLFITLVFSWAICGFQCANTIKIQLSVLV